MNIVIALLVAAAVAGLALLQWRKAELSRKAETARARMIESLTDRFRDQEEFLAFARSDEGRLLLGARAVASEIGRRLLLHLRRGESREEIALPPADSYRLELENMSAAIRGEAEPLLGRKDAVGQARALDALRRSAEAARPVELAG